MREICAICAQNGQCPQNKGMPFKSHLCLVFQNECTFLLGPGREVREKMRKVLSACVVSRKTRKTGIEWNRSKQSWYRWRIQQRTKAFKERQNERPKGQIFGLLLGPSRSMRIYYENPMRPTEKSYFSETNDDNNRSKTPSIQ